MEWCGGGGQSHIEFLHKLWGRGRGDRGIAHSSAIEDGVVQRGLRQRVRDCLPVRPVSKTSTEGTHGATNSLSTQVQSHVSIESTGPTSRRPTPRAHSPTPSVPSPTSTVPRPLPHCLTPIHHPSLTCLVPPNAVARCPTPQSYSAQPQSRPQFPLPTAKHNGPIPSDTGFGISVLSGA